MSAPVPSTAEPHAVFAELDVHAIPFITVSEDGGSGGDAKFEVNPDALVYLRSLRGPVAVVAIAGLYRTGKSYLLNLLMGRGAGFSVGPTVKACTKGIWIWGKALTMEASPSGPTSPSSTAPTTVLFLDTEGLGSTVRGASYDSRVFALSVLLASSFVYNSVGVIDGEAIGRLSLVVQLTRHIHTQTLALGAVEPSAGDSVAPASAGSGAGTAASDSNDGGSSSLGAASSIYYRAQDRVPALSAGAGSDNDLGFPSFLWVVRDFGVRIEVQGGAMTSSQYLEHALTEEAGTSEPTLQKNGVRSLIKSVFPQRDCVTMVRPITDEKALSRLAEIALDDLRPEFQVQVRDLRLRVLGAVQPKRMFGRALTGPMLSQLALDYCASMNSNQPPVIRGAWERMAEQQCAQACEKAVAALQAALVSTVPTKVLDARTLSTLHANLTDEAVSTFNADAVIDCDSYPSHKAALLELVADELARAERRNVRNSEDLCRRTWEQAAAAADAQMQQSLQPLLTSNRLTSSAVGRCYSDAVKSVREGYMQAAAGPAMLTSLVDSLSAEAPKMLAVWLEAADESQARAFAATNAGYEQKMMDANTSADVQRQQLRLQIEDARLANVELACANALQSTQLTATEAEHAVLTASTQHLQQQLEVCVKQRDTTGAELATERTRAANELAKAQAAVEAERSEWSSTKARLENRLSACENERDSATASASKLSLALTEAASDQSLQLHSLVAAWEQRLQDARSEADLQRQKLLEQVEGLHSDNAELHSTVAVVTSRLSASESQCDHLQQQVNDMSRQQWQQTQAQAEVEVLRQQGLRAALLELEHAKAELQACTTQLAACTRERDAAVAAVSSLTAELAGCVAARDTAQQERGVDRQEHARLTTELHSLQQANDRLVDNCAAERTQAAGNAKVLTLLSQLQAYVSSLPLEVGRLAGLHASAVHATDNTASAPSREHPLVPTHAGSGSASFWSRSAVSSPARSSSPLREMQAALTSTTTALARLQQDVADMKAGSTDTAPLTHDQLLAAAHRQFAMVSDELMATQALVQTLGAEADEMRMLVDEGHKECVRAGTLAREYELAWAQCKAEFAQVKGECTVLEAEVHVLTCIAKALKRAQTPKASSSTAGLFDSLVVQRKYESL